jgi:hypothetical protein
MRSPSLTIDRETGEVIEHGTFDHQAGAARFVALCQAMGWLHEEWEAITGEPMFCAQRERSSQQSIARA